MTLISCPEAATRKTSRHRSAKVRFLRPRVMVLFYAPRNAMITGTTVRFWITKNSELPVREQLVRQVLLGILSEDLPAGHKLPSVRAVARRHQIHSNTVSAAYHDLLEQGWLELRRGSGLYVRPLQPDGDGQLDQLLTGVLQAARRKNYEPEEVLHRLEHMIHPVAYQRVLIAEPEPSMRE